MRTRLLVGLELLIAVNAIYGGIGLMVNGMGMPEDWLERTPFSSWVIPGILLLLVIAGPMIVAAVAELRHDARAYVLSLAAGILQLGWILGQVLVLGRFFFLQPVLFVAGGLVVLLAWWAHRGHPLMRAGD
jgi:hypothetical protein